MTATRTPLETRLERVPDRRLPVLYFVFAHLCLLTAFGALAFVPQSLAGFFYHPRMLAVVHLVTLGWITSSILGALYMILPMALRSALPARRLDHWAFWCFVVGVLGMVSHFWIDESSGMVWSAAMVIIALAVVGRCVVRSLSGGKAPIEHRLPFYLAFVNIVLAGLLGALIGIDKTTDVLPGYVLDHVAAHAHLAALGWATFMVMGAAYRLLPMFLPAAVPRGRALLAESLLTEVGLLALVAGLFYGARWVVLPALAYAAGVALFLRRVGWMLGNRRPSPKELVRPDLAFGHIAAAFSCLVLATGLGLWLATMPASESTPRLIMLYGILALIGFLAQMVVGISIRLLPLYAWMRQFAGTAFEELPPSPHTLVRRSLHWATLLIWGAGVPLLATGLALDLFWAIRSAAAALGLSVGLGLLHFQILLRPHRSTPVETRDSS